ncbi:heptaprenylglyceryl phosphate synthase [Paludifilum halophilum]|uniref:Heptaprenylglyceryl phosphate synthase n=1 Tax=Paludifilum halophilum TaxID=1642702 RepID=A0A235B6B5_9BACL|nr:heptaprenylglyceryl phosphate synthase [Paludifilum halophilum]OYD07519.1 geranylgeranylglyceryl/heptaprenylglyceryl phosphate synthase [Paludifilum halophilum]
MLRQWIKGWRHAFKLDPDRVLSDRALERICLSGTDAVIVGGTEGVTQNNSRELLDRVSEYPVKCVQEVSGLESVVPGLDGYLIPTVLNAGDLQWVVGLQHQAVKKFGEWIPWEDLAVLGYVVLNPNSRVARLTGSRTELASSDVTAYGRIAEHLFHLPALYVEYSGVYGDPSIVEAARNGLDSTQLIYGGGVSNEEQARRMAAVADTVIVGNLVYRNADAAVETVHWVKETTRLSGV